VKSHFYPLKTNAPRVEVLIVCKRGGRRRIGTMSSGKEGSRKAETGVK
jgi:hypothetical protein